MNQNNRVEMCHCGHHKDTHFKTLTGTADCLGMGCNDCRYYSSADKPESLPSMRYRTTKHIHITYDNIGYVLSKQIV